MATAYLQPWNIYAHCAEAAQVGCKKCRQLKTEKTLLAGTSDTLAPTFANYKDQAVIQPSNEKEMKLKRARRILATEGKTPSASANFASWLSVQQIHQA